MKRPSLKIDWSSWNDGKRDTTGMSVSKVANAVALFSIIGNPAWFEARLAITFEDYKKVVDELSNWLEVGAEIDDATTTDFHKAVANPKLQLEDFQWSETPHNSIGTKRFLRTSPYLNSVYYFFGIAAFESIDTNSYDPTSSEATIRPETVGVVFNRLWSVTSDFSFINLVDFLRAKTPFSGLRLIVASTKGLKETFHCVNPSESSKLMRTVEKHAQDEAVAPTFSIFYGPPGTGKTRLAKEEADARGWNCEVVQFHASYNYEDFIEGIRPITFPDGQLKYDVIEGPLKIMAHKASGNYPVHTLAHITFNSPESPTEAVVQLPMGFTKRYEIEHVKVSETSEFGPIEPIKVFNDTIIIPQEILTKRFRNLLEEQSKTGQGSLVKKIFIMDAYWGTESQCLILDEINRANISQVMGELIYVLADQDSVSQKPVTLQYSGEKFVWPRRLNIIGTMNTADTSTERLDQAIKRRFVLQPVPPDSKVFRLGAASFSFLKEYCERHKAGGLIENIESLNDLVTKGFGSKVSPEDVLKSINDRILNDAKKKYGVIHPDDKLLGHSYFLKLCRRLCHHDPTAMGGMEIALYIEAVELFWHEVTPALLSVFNHDESVTKLFYQDLIGDEINDNLFSIGFHDKLIRNLFYKPGAITEEKIDKFASAHPIKWRPRKAA